MVFTINNICSELPRAMEHDGTHVLGCVSWAEPRKPLMYGSWLHTRSMHMLPLADAVHELSFGATVEQHTIPRAYMTLSLVLPEANHPINSIKERIEWQLTDPVTTYSQPCSGSGSLSSLEQLEAVERAVRALVNRGGESTHGRMPATALASVGQCIDRWLSKGLYDWTPVGTNTDVIIMKHAQNIYRLSVHLGYGTFAEEALQDAITRWAHLRLRMAATTRICDALFKAYTDPSYALCKARLSAEFKRMHNV